MKIAKKSEALVPTSGPAALALAHALGARFDSVSMTIEDPDLSWEHWRDIGRAIGFVGSTWHWWLGDWFNLGEELYGDKASAAVDDVASRYEAAQRITGNATGTLQNIKSIALRVPRENRKEPLSIWTHGLVAKLEPKEQKRWLNLAVKKKWRRSDLKIALNGGDPDEPKFPEAEPGADPDEGAAANAGVSRDERIERAAKNVLSKAQDHGDGTHTVPSEQIVQLREAVQ